MEHSKNRPLLLKVSLLFLSASWLISVCSSLVDFLKMHSVATATVTLSQARYAYVEILYIYIIIFLFLAFIYWKVSQGERWSRWTLLACFVGQLLFIITMLLLGSIPLSLGYWIKNISSVVVFIMQLVAVILLFTSPVSQWFKEIDC